MRTFKRHVVLLIFAMLSGCAANSLIQPGEATIGNFTVDNPTEWSRLRNGAETIWTKDGVLLNRIVVITVKDGQHILLQRLSDRNEAFTYDSESNLEDIIELFVDAGETGGLLNLTLESASYRMIDGREAVEVELYYDSEENLRYNVIGLFVKDNKKLHRLVCVAPAEHYFPAYEPFFRKMIASARIKS